MDFVNDFIYPFLGIVSAILVIATPLMIMIHLRDKRLKREGKIDLHLAYKGGSRNTLSLLDVKIKDVPELYNKLKFLEEEHNIVLCPISQVKEIIEKQNNC